MVEKGLLLVAIAVAIIMAVSALGSAMSKMMVKTECAWSHKTICIVEDPNMKKL